ncbi:hypothetical protein [Halalkalibacter alkalisediminis]|uniref:Secreted protein n=1 Tax=Halalkalibacter alkalisediminis TaxID=935616 RepID=A0ABV6NH01_9BACI|nr:hypothetical protein [Halalkalibacter alkalisediminis]
MTKTVRNWVVSAMVILLAVIGGYYSLSDANNIADHEHSSSPEHSEEEHQHQYTDSESTLEVELTYTDDTITISMLNQDGNIPELAVTHEKLMHLIIISNDLETFIHLHPEQTEEGTFVIEPSLEHTDYQAFIDIKPVNDVYVTEPITLNQDHHSHQHRSLHPTSNKVSEVDGMTVELTHEKVEAGQSVSLSFDLKNASPEPYLGALGHVVIVDEHLATFIHVHPESEDDTIFEAHFDEAGMYKLWAEFKVDGEVRIFPFVLEVE